MIRLEAEVFTRTGRTVLESSMESLADISEPQVPAK